MKLINPLTYLSIKFILIYQLIISPILNKKICCRFYPTCSNYGILVLKKYGFIKGWCNAINRVKRCRVDNFNSCVDLP